jgi:beta-lactam-binding protein with PASTA domain
MKRGMLLTVGAVFFVFLLAGCGASSSGDRAPDTEGRTLAQAQQALSDAGMSEENVTVNSSVTGGQSDPNSLTVCDQHPDGANVTKPVTLDVAESCPDAAEEEEDDNDRKRKRSSGGRRR